MPKIIKTLVAIGGGELGELETLPIDKKIVKLAKKVKPTVLFIPTASNDAKGDCDTFQKIYSDKLHCQVDFLLLLTEKLTKKEIAQKILSADIIYVGGGDTLKMLKIWQKQGIDELLKKAWKKGIILSGLSAGAICWFKYGVSDAVKNSKDQTLFGKVKGLNFLENNIIISPHHIREKEIREKSLREILQNTSCVGLAMDDCTALVIQNNNCQIWHSKKNTKIKKTFKQNNKIIKKNLPTKGTLQNLLTKK